MKKNVFIIGCSICSLYAGTKLLELGNNVSIVDRKTCFTYGDPKSNYCNYIVYNSNHLSFIRLLKQFGIQGKKVKKVLYNDKFYSLLQNIKNRIKFIPPKYLELTTSFHVLRQFLTRDEMLFLKSINIDHMIKILNIKDFLKIFSLDFSNQTFFVLDEFCLQNLHKRLMQAFLKQGGVVHFNTNISGILYKNSKFILNDSYVCDVLFTIIGQHNLLLFDIWNKKQREILRSVSPIDASIVNNIFDNLLKINHNKCNNNIENVLLEELHIVYPKNTKTKKLVYLWNYNVNDVEIRNMIRNLFHDNFIICSESFSKNNMFINYSIEFVDNLLINFNKN
jgi:hypothetical protein